MDPFRPGRATRLCTSERIVQWNFDDGGGGEIFVFEKRRGEGGDLPPFDKWAVRPWTVPAQGTSILGRFVP